MKRSLSLSHNQTPLRKLKLSVPYNPTPKNPHYPFNKANVKKSVSSMMSSQWLVIVGKPQALLITLTMALFFWSVPVSHDTMIPWPTCTIPGPWNRSSWMELSHRSFIIYSCVFPFTCQNVSCEKGISGIICFKDFWTSICDSYVSVRCHFKWILLWGILQFSM